ncbi:zinc finger protein 2 isoform X1 [Drosophila mauritiana]|uniref:Zinc finger protein 2 isoform X1 n=2 Tax=Drosophila mauritiana TaxID=7226 RepID=A0A6P8K8K7_DROMA|nr:zinc finger protein 2 isoform X1 [Drosophila mauritiana]
MLEMEKPSQCHLCASCFRRLNPTIIFSLEILAKIKDLTGIWLEQNERQPRHICPSCLNDLNTSIKLKNRIQRVHDEATLRWEYGLDEDLSSTVSDIEPEEDSSDLESEESHTTSYSEHQEGKLSDLENYPFDKKAEEFEIDLNLDNGDSRNGPHNPNDSESPLIFKYKNPLIETTSLAKENLPETVDAQSPKKGNFIQIGSDLSLLKTGPSIKVVKPLALFPEGGAAENVPPAKRRARKIQSLECPKCEKVFKTPYNLKTHMVRHTGEKNFPCTFCDKRFVTKYLVRLHERVRHMGEQPFKCNFCSKTFFTSSAKSRHERIRHIRDLSYQCDQCTKRFNTKTCLNKHKFLHTGLKPFDCVICQINFARKAALRRHFDSVAHLIRANAILEIEGEH